ncbi:MAG: SLC13 family permease [Anaeroplasmataceae bacterium]
MSLVIMIITCTILILSIIFFPKIKKINTFYIISILGALAMLIFGQITPKEIYNALFLNKLISPIKILILFISMSFISITLDTLGFFNYIATLTLKKSSKSQIKLFTMLYIAISLLTIFTSNDVVILTFTPFICYFCKKAKINPIPYLISEFVAANTLSMMLEIGNPTNILISVSNNITFLEYLKVMLLPTAITCIVVYFLLLLIFIKPLKENINLIDIELPQLNKIPVGIALAHLILATILLTISNYINLEMYLITLVLSISLFICLFIYKLISKNNIKALSLSLKRLPYGLIPFLISMFILVEALNINGYTIKLANMLNSFNNVYSYGITSYLACNVMNNIPMSVLFSNALQYNSSTKAIYATIIGSNIGAYLTPLGALAGIMWLSILNAFEIKFSFLKFIKYGILISIVALLTALTVLYI